MLGGKMFRYLILLDDYESKVLLSDFGENLRVIWSDMISIALNYSRSTYTNERLTELKERKLCSNLIKIAFVKKTYKKLFWKNSRNKLLKYI